MIKNCEDEINLEELDELNKDKYEMQQLMPVVELMKIKAPPNSLIGLERDQKLACMGYSTEQIEDMTGYGSGDHQFQFTAPDSEENKIRFYGKEIMDKMKALDIKMTEEWRLEHDRILKNGIRLGFIEEELGQEPKL